VNRFGGAVGQFFDGAAGHENGGEFRHVGAVGGVACDDERVFYESWFRVLDTSLPQNGAVGAGADVVAGSAGYNGGPTFAVTEDAMIAFRPYQPPAIFFRGA